MQIICNNCGNNLTFPNQQHLVTCPHCHTHLQIEELENTISATVVENPDFSQFNLFSSSELSTLQSFAPLYNLLHLENAYSESIEDNFFHSVLLWRRFRPVLLRGVSRFFFGVFFVFFAVEDFWDGVFWSVLTIVYGLFLIRVSIKECVRWWRLRQFEKYYFQEQPELIENIQTSDFPQKLRQLFTDYQENNDIHLQIRNDYFYYYFLKFRIYIGTSVLSQSFRLLPLGFFFSVIVANLFDNYLYIFLIVIPFIIIFFIIISKSSDYNGQYSEILKERKSIIQGLNNYLSQ